MTIKEIIELIDMLDGYGLIATDDDLLKQRLKELGYREQN